MAKKNPIQVLADRVVRAKASAEKEIMSQQALGKDIPADTRSRVNKVVPINNANASTQARVKAYVESISVPKVRSEINSDRRNRARATVERQRKQAMSEISRLQEQGYQIPESLVSAVERGPVSMTERGLEGYHDITLISHIRDRAQMRYPLAKDQFDHQGLDAAPAEIATSYRELKESRRPVIRALSRKIISDAEILLEERKQAAKPNANFKTSGSLEDLRGIFRDLWGGKLPSNLDWLPSAEELEEKWNAFLDRSDLDTIDRMSYGPVFRKGGLSAAMLSVLYGRATSPNLQLDPRLRELVRQKKYEETKQAFLSSPAHNGISAQQYDWLYDHLFNTPIWDHYRRRMAINKAPSDVVVNSVLALQNPRNTTNEVMNALIVALDKTGYQLGAEDLAKEARKLLDTVDQDELGKQATDIMAKKDDE